MHFRTFDIALHQEPHVEIPEADSPTHASLNGCIDDLKRPQAAG